MITNALGYTFFGSNDDETVAQVRFKDSKFSHVLAEYSERSENIVEIGTWKGQGSTFCLWTGMKRESQRMWTIEADKLVSHAASKLYNDPRVKFLWGTVCTDSEHQNPRVVGELPPWIDLCLMDGGGGNHSASDFVALGDRCKWIALDDTNDAKNKSLRQRMIDLGWKVLHDDLNDRLGTFLAQNPTV